MDQPKNRPAAQSEPRNGKNGEPARIGVYICHCGTNIAGRVDVQELVRAATELPGVVVARDCPFLCADPGQELILRDIQELDLSRIVVSSCSPRVHEPTFRHVCARAGLSPFLMTTANIREQCSWVTIDREAATDKAEALVRGAVARAGRLDPLEVREAPANPAVMVIGGGIAGIQAALEVAGAGRKVVLVERESSLGGHLARFDKTFPTLDCAACLLLPKMASVRQSPNIEMLTYSEVVSVCGHIGSFQVKVRRKARLVDEEKCNGCGTCWGACPARIMPRDRTVLLGGKPIRVAGPAAMAWNGAPRPPHVGRLLEELRREYQERVALARGGTTHPCPICAGGDGGGGGGVTVPPADCRARNEGDCDLCGLCLRMCRDVVGLSVLAIEGVGEGEPTRALAARNPERCIECGACAEVCLSGHLQVISRSGGEIRHDEVLLGPDAAIAPPFLQALPAVPVIDKNHCLHFKTGGCGACRDLCERQAIDYEAKDVEIQFEVGSIITATGFRPFDPSPLAQYGYGRLRNVVTALEFEQMNNASGTTGGRILTTNGEPPESVALIHCVGSRDRNHHEYCSRVCCMTALKYAHLIREKTGAAVYDFFVDLRCFGKGYEELYNGLLEEGVFFIRGRPGEVSDFAIYEEERGKLIVRCEDTLIGIVRRIPVDLVVLLTALEPAADVERVARLLNLPRSRDGFFLEQHPKLAPVATPVDGVFIAGACQGPKDIPDTVAQASAAAAAAISLSVRGRIEIDPVTCQVDSERCSGCRICHTLCPFTAITFDDDKGVCAIDAVLCKGCGSCAAACPSAAIRAWHFTDDQILAEIAGVCA